MTEIECHVTRLDSAKVTFKSEAEVTVEKKPLWNGNGNAPIETYQLPIAAVVIATAEWIEAGRPSSVIVNV